MGRDTFCQSVPPKFWDCRHDQTHFAEQTNEQITTLKWVQAGVLGRVQSGGGAGDAQWLGAGQLISARNSSPRASVPFSELQEHLCLTCTKHT